MMVLALVQSPRHNFKVLCWEDDTIKKKNNAYCTKSSSGLETEPKGPQNFKWNGATVKWLNWGFQHHWKSGKSVNFKVVTENQGVFKYIGKVRKYVNIF